MSTISQASYVAKLSKATQLHQYLLTYENYTPGDDTLTIEALMNHITDLHTIQNAYTQTQNNYLLATALRKKSFDKEPNSIAKLLSPIGSYLKAKTVKDTRFYDEVNALILKIRGAKRKSITENSSENTISTSERSYGSQLQNFKDILTLLEEFGTDYQPANESILLINLKNTYNEALSKNNEVSKTLGLFKPTIKSRQKAYKKLVIISNGIKNMVKSQYGIESSEYNLIKGIAF